VTGNGLLIALMGFLFLFLGYVGVPVAFALIASVLLVTVFTPVSEASMIAQIFNGMDVEALLAVPFFLLVGDLMTSAKVTMRMITLSHHGHCLRCDRQCLDRRVVSRRRRSGCFGWHWAHDLQPFLRAGWR
jgi:TRAP-type mannitol/chloroaromatic compound transport system permease large subunit